MRPLAVLLWLLGLVCAGQDSSLAEQTPKARALAIAERASEIVDNMSTPDSYVEFLEPTPNRMLRMSDMSTYVAFVAGWHPPEKWGIWSLGQRSVLYLRLPSGSRPTKIFVNGRYLGEEEPTRLFVNDVLLSEAPVQNLNIALPASIHTGTTLKIEFQHLNPVSPHDLDPSVGDRRKMKFGLTQLKVR